MRGTPILTEADLAAGAAALAELEPRFGDALARIGAPRLRNRPAGFAGLVRIILAQQITVAAADSLWRRVESAGLHERKQLSIATDDQLRACGLTRPKQRALRAAAESDLDFDALAALPEAEAKAALCALRGVGPWTAEIYLMFCLGRPDVFAPGDLALQEGAKLLFGLDARPAPRALTEMARGWSPWRAVAARVLWDWYLLAKGREGTAG